MIFLIGAFTIIHVIFYMNLAFHWRRIQEPSIKEQLLPFSIIIPVRNESENIHRILECLQYQSYPKELYEVIIIDDFSEDDTIKMVHEINNTTNLSIRIFQLTDPTRKGKKYALTEGVKQATYDWIITTDADCWMNEGWLKSFNNVFEDNINMVAGPVSIVGSGLFGRLQQVEFAGLIGFGAVTLQEENPSMCSGANLGFKKQAFEAVRGYENNLFIPSGDDEFLLYNIMTSFPHSTRFLKASEAVVHTAAHSRLSSFINQRTRWTSKWKYNKNWKVRFSAILFFLDYLLFIVAVLLTIIGEMDKYYLLMVLGLRYISLLLFVAPINSFLKGKNSLFPFLLFQIIYPLHVLFMGMNSIFGTYTWKGRKY